MSANITRCCGTLFGLRHAPGCPSMTTEHEPDWRALSARLAEALQEVCDDSCGPEHDEDCPEDDTCECRIVGLVNRAMGDYAAATKERT